MIKITFILAFALIFSCEKSELSEIDATRKGKEKVKDNDDRSCETAYAYYSENCFLDDDDLNSNKWGWTIGPLSSPTNITYPIYAGAGQCNINNGELVGELNVLYLDDGTLEVEYIAYSSFGFFETHLYVGNEKYPRKNNGQFTVAPGQYGNSNSYEEGSNYDNYSFSNLEGEVYVIAHAVVCEVEEEECIIDPGTIKPDVHECAVFLEDSELSATPDGNAIVPDGFEVLYILTTGAEMTIVALNESPNFLINNAGTYRIHTLVYDPATLDLSFVIPEVTLAEEILSEIANNELCAALDAEGAVFKVEFCEKN